ncbi:hypothetical protein ACTG4Q_20920 [Bradyrhizobium denitrificans]
MRDDLYISERSANSAGQKAVEEKRADTYRVKRKLQRNPDRSRDFGFVAVLMRSGQAVGFA